MHNKSVKELMMGTIAEKVPCELKDHRQQGLVQEQRHTLTNVSTR